MTYTVCCPKLNETEVCYSQEHAIDVAYSMHDESNSYVWVEDYLGHTVIELGDIVEGISQLVFAWPVDKVAQHRLQSATISAIL